MGEKAVNAKFNEYKDKAKEAIISAEEHPNEYALKKAVAYCLLAILEKMDE